MPRSTTSTTRARRILVRMYGCAARSAFTIMDMSSNDARHRAEQQQSARDSSAVLITVILASTVIAIVMIGAAVALSLAGRELQVIVGLVGPVAAAAVLMVAALGKLVSLDRKQDRQTEKIEQVAHQTNGALQAELARRDAATRAHMERAISAALERHLGPAPTPPNIRKRPPR